MSKVTECPVCWNKDVRMIDAAYQENQGIIKSLMFCDVCENYYWGDTNETVRDLSSFCEISDLRPEICYLEKSNSNLSKEACISKRKQQEFDLLCGFCPHRLLHL